MRLTPSEGTIAGLPADSMAYTGQSLRKPNGKYLVDALYPQVQLQEESEANIFLGYRLSSRKIEKTP
jgi:hypothetical protein